jgi:hypothetical protein
MRPYAALVCFCDQQGVTVASKMSDVLVHRAYVMQQQCESAGTEQLQQQKHWRA